MHTYNVYTYLHTYMYIHTYINELKYTYVKADAPTQSLGPKTVIFLV